MPISSALQLISIISPVRTGDLELELVGLGLGLVLVLGWSPILGGDFVS